MPSSLLLRRRRWVAALVVVPVVAAAVFAVVPVTVVPARALPGWAQAVLPSELANAELSCGSVVSPYDPSAHHGVTGVVGTLLRSSCTATVRDRLWIVVWALVIALALAAVSVSLSLQARRAQRCAAPD